MKYDSIKKQKGVTMLFVLVFLFGLFLAIAWATDSGNWLLMKTREQNAIDAIALSAAIALNDDPNFSTSVAQTAGRETCELFQQSIGNDGLTDIDCQSTTQLTFEFSKHLVDPDTGGWNPGTTPARFVRVESSALIAEPILIQMMGGFEDGQTIYSVATAGATGDNCRVVPFVMCADMPDWNSDLDPDHRYCLDTPEPELGDANYQTYHDYCDPVDVDCSDGECYGYEIDVIYPLQNPCFKDQGQAESTVCNETLEAGNFSLLNLDSLQGGKDIRDVITSEEGVGLDVCTSKELNTKPGYTWGNVKQGINDRYMQDGYTTPYPFETWKGADKEAYNDYKTQPTANFKREMAVFLGDCRGPQNGTSPLPKVGNACMLLTEKAGQLNGAKTVYGEFAFSCKQSGIFSPLYSELLGPYRVVLFKSAGSQDS